MTEQEILYSQSSVLIASVLFISILAANEAGFRLGRFIQKHTDTEIKAQTGAIQASMLGLLALLLGFTFSMSMQRYNDRSQSVIEEANAIGTVFLRTHLLPYPYQDQVQQLLKEYVDLRVAVGKVDLTRIKERQQYNRRLSEMQNQPWSLAVAATDKDPRAVTSGSFVTAPNALIDSQGKRNALLQMHVPEIVLFLLFAVFVTTGGLLGYSSGLGGRRVVMPAAIMSFLIVLTVFIIIDLDRPKRGLIQVDQGSLVDLQQQDSRDKIDR